MQRPKIVPDFDKVLQLNIQNLKRYEKEKPVVIEEKDSTLSLKNCDYQFHGGKEFDSIYLWHVHTCNVYLQFADEHQVLNETTLYAHFRRYEIKNLELFGKLHVPNNVFFYYTANSSSCLK